MPDSLPWLMLVISLSGQNTTARMRVWRALKAAGAGALRDGVYVLPASPAADDVFRQQAAEVVNAGGQAHVLPLASSDAQQETLFRGLFDRSDDYAAVLGGLDTLFASLEAEGLSESEARRRLTQVQRQFDSLAAIDFFPTASRRGVDAAMADAEPRLNRHYAPDEPKADGASWIPRQRADFQGRVWATRAGLWVDRVASAWLIRRFIDSQARFVWLASITDCPRDAIGFDFEGAMFTHVGPRVTFEVLMASFGLDADAGLAGIAALVHYLDVGGIAVPEAAGFRAVLAGARARLGEDDALLVAMSDVLDDLYATYADPELIATRGRKP